ncbi:22149_t:CDS:2, partial [Cetraspora pellucida]
MRIDPPELTDECYYVHRGRNISRKHVKELYEKYDITWHRKVLDICRGLICSISFTMNNVFNNTFSAVENKCSDRTEVAGIARYQQTNCVNKAKLSELFNSKVDCSKLYNKVEYLEASIGEVEYLRLGDKATYSRLENEAIYSRLYDENSKNKVKIESDIYNSEVEYSKLEE